ncbi:MAG TPA: HYR domain-containing protein [Vicinamibacterales bacterium]|nr:HYR domain-containing protein [Vicinamibacterales bacterium]
MSTRITFARATRPVVPLALALLAFAGPVSAQAVDQSFDPSPLLGPSVSGFGFAISGSQQLAQTFTVGVTGRLSAVSILADGFGAATRPVLVQVRTVQAGLPAEGPGAVLAEGWIPAAVMLGASGLRRVAFPDDGPQVFAGQILSIVVSSEEQIGSYGWQAGVTSSATSTLLYTRGAAAFRSSTGPWRHHTNETDYGFTTEVLAEPLPPGHVFVNPGDYKGEWWVGPVMYRGPNVVPLPVGTTRVILAGSDFFDVTVAADGIVTTSRPEAVQGGQGTLTFQTVDIEVDPEAFTGDWSVDRVTAHDMRGRATATVVRGLWYRMTAGTGMSTFMVHVAADGWVSVQNGVSAIGGLRTLTFRSLDVTIQPGVFTGPWVLSRITGPLTGSATVRLVYGTRYELKTLDGFFVVVVGPDGQVSAENGLSASGGHATLRFNTETVNVDPAEYTGGWFVSHLTDYIHGPASVVIVPGVRFGIVAGNVFYLQAGEAGIVTVENGVSAQGGPNTVIFNTRPVMVDPGGAPGGWSIHAATGLMQGTAIVHLVTEVTYLFQAQGTAVTFRVGADCELTPPSVDVAGQVFAFTCDPDVVPPVISGPGDIVADADRPEGAIVTYEVTARDERAGGVPVTCTPSSGSLFPPGQTLVTCTASDMAGNVAQQQFVVTVNPLVVNAAPIAVACCDIDVDRWRRVVNGPRFQRHRRCCRADIE